MRHTAAVAIAALSTACASVRATLLPEPEEEKVVGTVHPPPAPEEEPLEEPAPLPELPFEPALLLGTSLTRAGSGGPLVVEPVSLLAPTLPLGHLGPALGRRCWGVSALAGFGGPGATPLVGGGLSVCLERPSKVSLLQPRLTLGVVWEDPAHPHRMRLVGGLTVAR